MRAIVEIKDDCRDGLLEFLSMVQGSCLELILEPDWKKAPAWASYWAMDDDGDCIWYEEEPLYEDGLWCLRKHSRMLTDDSYGDRRRELYAALKPEESLRIRPELASQKPKIKVEFSI